MGIKNFLQYASQQYFNEGKPIISDEVYDELEKRYGGLEKVGAEVGSNKVEHYTRVYSLQKVFEGEDAVPSIFKNKALIETSKLDGGALILTYIDGKLVQAATRGDGYIGQDITEKFQNTSLVPQEIGIPGIIQITGEFAVPLASKVKNIRNYASGSLNLKDPHDFWIRVTKDNLQFIAYNVTSLTDSYSSDMGVLILNGFRTILEVEDGEFPTDGTVYRIDSNSDFDLAGYTEKHPRGAYALKSRESVAIEETTLNKVVWQVGGSGKVTPVAEFGEVVIEDAKINRATLHNAGFIEDMDLHLGDTILITRAGGVIPKVVGKL